MQSLADFFTQTAVSDAPKNTGRVPDIALAGGNREAYNAYRISGDNVRTQDGHPSFFSETIHYRQSASPLNLLFFSVANVNKVQQLIADAVLSKSGGRYKIDRQSDDELFIIMRSYYLQYARNDPGKVNEELDSLNDRVVAYASDKVMVHIEAYKYYRADQENFPEPIAAPVNVHVYGTRTGELKSFF
jgi:hypothetical protein